MTLKVALADYPQVAPISISFKTTVLAIVKNNLPYFEQPVSGVLEITLTQQPLAWFYKLPKILDKDNDQVKLNVQLGLSSAFVEFDPASGTFAISNIQEGSNDLLKAGNFKWTLSLNDGRDTVNVSITLVVKSQVVEQTQAT